MGQCGGRKPPTTRTERRQRRRNAHANDAPDHPEAKDSQALTLAAGALLRERGMECGARVAVWTADRLAFLVAHLGVLAEVGERRLHAMAERLELALGDEPAQPTSSRQPAVAGWRMLPSAIRRRSSARTKWRSESVISISTISGKGFSSSLTLIWFGTGRCLPAASRARGFCP